MDKVCPGYGMVPCFCRKELAELRDELQRAEDERFEHEEELWRVHEQQRADLAETGRVAAETHEAALREHRELLALLLDEHARSEAEAELDLDEAKRRLVEDARAGRNDRNLENGARTCAFSAWSKARNPMLCSRLLLGHD